MVDMSRTKFGFILFLTGTTGGSSYDLLLLLDNIDLRMLLLVGLVEVTLCFFSETNFEVVISDDCDSRLGEVGLVSTECARSLVSLSFKDDCCLGFAAPSNVSDLARGAGEFFFFSI